MKKFFSLILICLIILGGCTQETAGTEEENDVIKLNLGMVNNENTNYYQGAEEIAAEVAEATDNRVQINIMAGGALGGERDTVEQVITGDLDMAVVANPVLSNFIPEMDILDQPFLFQNADQAHAAVDGAVGDLIEEEARGLGLHVIGYMEAGFRNVFSNRPVTSIEDFQGLKIRTMENKYHRAAFDSFGAVPMPLSSDEQFTALQQGTIDAMENAVSDALSQGYYEIITDITYVDYAYVFMLVTMSDNAWNKIPDDLQEPFLEAVERGNEAQRQYLVEANEEAEEELEDLGVEFHDIDQDELREAYRDLENEEGFEFDPKWQEALDEAISNH